MNQTNQANLAPARDVSIAGRKVKLADFVKHAGFVGKDWGRAKFFIEMGMVMVDGVLSGHLSSVGPRTKLTGGELVTCLAVTEDPNHSGIIPSDLRHGPTPHGYRYVAETVRAVSSADAEQRVPYDEASPSPSALRQGDGIFIESRRFEPIARAGQAVPAYVYEIGNRSGVRSTVDSLGWLVAGLKGARKVAVSPGGDKIAVNVCQAPPEPYFGAYGERPVRGTQGVTVMQNMGYSSTGFAFSPDGKVLANIEFVGGVDGALTMLRVADGARAILTTVSNVTGSEQPRWSSDGKWLLIDIHPHPLLVSMEFEWVVELPIDGRCDWWPAGGASTLFVVEGSHPDQAFAKFDLATGEYTRLRPIVLPEAPELESFRQYVSRPRVSPDGTKVMIGLNHGPDQEFQHQNGSRHRVAFANIETGIAEVAYSPFVDDAGWVEREHSSWSWVSEGIPTWTPVDVSDALSADPTPWSRVDPCEDYPMQQRDETIVVVDFETVPDAEMQIVCPHIPLD